MNRLDVRKFYYTFGVELPDEGPDAKGICPFCGGEQFFVLTEKKKGTKHDECSFQCKHCMSEGNKFTFMQLVYENSDYVHDSDWQRIIESQGIEQEVIESIAYPFEFNSNIFFPVWNKNESIVNHLKLNDDFRLFGLSGCGVQLYGLWDFKDSETVWIVEGQWDYIAWKHIINSMELEDDVLAVPGVGSFSETWLGLFAGKNVNILFDNDYDRHHFKCTKCHAVSYAQKKKPFIPCKKCKAVSKPTGRVSNPSQDGIARLTEMFNSMTKKPNQLNRLAWSEGLKDGFDIRDLYLNGVPE